MTLAGRTERSRRRGGGALVRVAILCSALSLALTLAGAATVASAALGAAAPAQAATVVSGTPLQLLARIPVAPEHRGGYLRSLFGGWIDADRDGCSTRREVLIAESLTPVRVGTGCWLTGGRWWSAYEGSTTTSIARVAIDHVVALKEAWDSGAWAWSAATRRAYANDLGDRRTLRAVGSAINESKSDKDPSNWLPPRAAFRCIYVNDWIAVKVRWHLSADPSEWGRLRAIAAGCPAVTLRVALAAVP